MKKITVLLYLVHVFYGTAWSQKLSLQTGHAAEITVLKFSPDGRLLASGSEDNTIVLWDNKSGKQFVILSGHTSRINDIAFHPSKKIMASASDDNTVRIWEYPSGKLLNTHSFFGHSVKSIAYSITGDTLACGSDFIYLINTHDRTFKTYGKKARDSYNALIYSSDGKYLAYGGKREFNTYLANTTQLEDTKIFKIKSNDLDFSKDSKYLFAAGKSGQISRYAVKKSNFFSRYRIASNNFFNGFSAVTDNDTYFIGANNDNLIYVYNKKNGKKKYLLKGHFEEITSLAISADGNFLASSGKDRYILLWNLEYGTFSKILSGTGTRINTIAFNKEGGELFIGYNNGIFRLWNLGEEGGIITGNTPRSNFYKGTNQWQYAITGCNDYFNDDEIFIKATLNLNNEEAKRYPKSRQDLIVWHPHEPDYNNGDGQVRYKGDKISKNNSFTLTDTAVNNFRFAATNPQRKPLFNSFKFSSPSKVVRAEASYSPLNNDRDILKMKQTKIKIKGDIIHQSMSRSGNLVAALIFNEKDSNRCDVIDMETGNLLFSFAVADDVNYIGFNPDDELIYTFSDRQQQIEVWSTTSQQRQYTLQGTLPVRFSKADGLMAYTNNLKELIVATANTGKELFRTPTEHTATISDIKFNPLHGFMATASHDGFIKFWDIATGALKVSLAAFNDHDFIYINPDNYYHASFGAIGNVSFTIGDNLYAFEQFDLKYNRPDKVMARLDFTSKTRISTYYRAYQKRVKRLGFTEADLKDLEKHHIPQFSIDLGNQFQIETTNPELIVHYTASDSLKNLLRVNVWLNDVPLYGEQGINIEDKQTAFYQDSLQLTLSPGINKVQLSVTNIDDAESMRETFEISHKDKNIEKPNLYIVAIGVSEYRNTMKNLDYAAKDARDIVALYSSQSSHYGRVEVDSFYNEHVTKENIRTIKEHLMQSHINDEVIIFFAGHGVLSKQYDYYLGTYGMDFDNPETGLSYDEFIGLMDGIPARKKLVLMDACHSGEIDKDAIKLAEKSTIKKGKKKFRAAGGMHVANANNTFEVMKSLFADFGLGSGAHVISSAGGTEYAQESDEWNNGIFTLCFLEGLRSTKADKNQDGQVDIIEIQEYLRTNVYELTDGQQLPTSRVANYSNNYTIWRKNKPVLWQKQVKN